MTLVRDFPQERFQCRRFLEALTNIYKSLFIEEERQKEEIILFFSFSKKIKLTTVKAPERGSTLAVALIKKLYLIFVSGYFKYRRENQMQVFTSQRDSDIDLH